MQRDTIYDDVKMLTLEDTPQILQLRNEIWEDLENKTLFAQSSDFYISDALQNGFGFGVWQKDCLIACVLCRHQNGTYAELLQYSESQKAKTIELEDVFVKKTYRGKGLQRYLVQQVQEYAKKINKSIILVTVSPQNSFSLKNFEDMGYCIKRCCTLYENLERYVLEKQLPITPENM